MPTPALSTTQPPQSPAATASPTGPAPVVVDLDDCARQVAAALNATATGIDPAGDIATAVYDTVRWLDAHNGTDVPELMARILKIGEENGEVVRAWIGMTGQNPRKGVTHTVHDVTDELADVVLAALVAIRSLAGNPAVALGRRARQILDRIGEQPSASRP